MVRQQSKFRAQLQTLPNGAFGSLFLAELTLAMTVIGCTLVEFNDAVSTDEMSYYGVHRKTIPILVLGLSLSIVFFLKAASRFDVPGAGHLISKALKFVSAAAITLVLTPYSVNTYFDLLHKTIGTTLFLGQLGLSLHWIVERSRDRIGWFAVLLQAVGGLVALLSLPHQSLGFQFEGQILFQIGFFSLLNHVSKEIDLSSS